MQLNRSVIGVTGYQGGITRPMICQLSVCGAQVIGLSVSDDDFDEQTRIDVMSEGASFVHKATRTPLDGYWRGNQVANWGLAIMFPEKCMQSQIIVDSKELQHCLALGCKKLMLVTTERGNYKEMSDAAVGAGIDFLSIALVTDGKTGSCLESAVAAKSIAAAAEFFFSATGVIAPSELSISC